jgi:phosphoenolpyruvate carboxykinase (GTP)
MPKPGDLNTQGLDINSATLAELMAVPRDLWRHELADLREYLQQYGGRLPAQMMTELDGVSQRLEA